MGNRQQGQPLSEDQKKLHNYFKPRIDEQKMEIIETKVKKNKYKYMGRAFVLGVVLEYYLGVGKAYDNIIRKSTTRRLDAKREEDRELEQKMQRKLQAQTNKAL